MISPSSPYLVECPRDSWQGFSRFIPTAEKISYLTQLIEAGFTHIDFGSFVSPQAVPQMKDTEEVWAAIRRVRPPINFIAIIANEHGLDRALAAGGIPTVGYPFSISETFQKNNTGKSIAESWTLLETLARRTQAAGIKLDVYLSMGFGNPYHEPWNVSLVTAALARFRDLSLDNVVLADTIGCARPAQITEVFAACRHQLGAHFHASPSQWRANVEAALAAGCSRLDSALGGIGGCPFAQEELVGNIPTEGVLPLLGSKISPATVLAEAQRLQQQYQ